MTGKKAVDADPVAGGGVLMSYEDAIQTISRELRELSNAAPRALQRKPNRRILRKRTSADLGPLLTFVATLISSFIAIAAYAFFAPPSFR